MREPAKLNRQTMGITAGIPLEATGTDIEGLRRDIQRLMDIEAIKQLKHCYLRCVDTANLEEMSELFHDDVHVHFKGGTYEWKLDGKAEYLAAIGQSFNTRMIGQHNGHHPEIQILSETEATGVWYLADLAWQLDIGNFLQGTLLYWDRYVKENGRWLIIETHYERLYEINTPLLKEPNLSSHYLGVHGTPMQE
ncbi:nuclear transport factor 2 family protein [Haliea sp. E1-2-M8]|uniref:nuclear transport factor 2 family protein n=1 Tax=Haliea sp. E1-2-M8 TaxID=3064706 RepID=UPI0027267AAD|nr:nuclear transport factor 2 family protein [Haliea sp. E1-2-M8]MDO8863038.1 nuclear transport factor 2 family protein [Haliea sp. E1-2-M8]